MTAGLLLARVCTLGDYIAIVGAPPVGGAWTSSWVAAIGTTRGQAIDDVMRDAMRAGVFGTLALVPASVIGLVAALAVC